MQLSKIPNKREPLYDAVKSIAIILILFHHATLGQEFFNQDTHLRLNEDTYFNFIYLKSWFYVFFWYMWSFVGKFGNTLFIGITALLLTRSYLSKKQPSPFVWMAKKLKRIYVPYLFLIPISILILVTLQGVTTSNTELLATIIGIQPYLGYWAGSLNGAWWYVSLISSLYLMFPLLFRLLQRLKAFKFLLLATIINIIIWNYSLKFSDQLPKNFSEFFLFNHLLTISIGMVLGLTLEKVALNKLSKYTFILLFILFLLAQLGDILGFPWLTFEFLFSRNIFLLAVLGSIVFFRRVISKAKPLFWLGDYTYSIFLSNLLVLNVVSFTMEWNLLLVTLFVIISCMAAWVLQVIATILDIRIKTFKGWVIYMLLITIISFVFLEYKNILDLILSSAHLHLGFDFLLVFIGLLLLKRKII